MKLKLILLLEAAFLLVACTGPTGPRGEKGDPGPGSRIVYQSTDGIPSNYWEVDIPEIDLDDMPNVSVYVSLEPPDDDFWFEVNLVLDYPVEDSWGYLLEDGKIILLNLYGFIYKIVIVT